MVPSGVAVNQKLATVDGCHQEHSLIRKRWWHSCEQMLTSNDAIERLMELRAADRTVFDKVKNFIRSIAGKVRQVYQGVKPDTREAQYVATMLDAFDQLQELWTEGVADAAKTASRELIIEALAPHAPE